MGEKRKRWTGEEIVTVIKRHLLEKAELSKICEEFGCCPSQVCRWEKQFFESGPQVFDRKPAAVREVQQMTQAYDELEKKLRRKDEVLAELMEEHVRLKKTPGAASSGSGSRTTRATKSSTS